MLTKRPCKAALCTTCALKINLPRLVCSPVTVTVMLCSEEVKRIIHCYDNIRSMSEDILLLHSNDVNRYLCSVAQWESPGFLMRRRRWVLLLEGVFLFSAEPPKLLAPGTESGRREEWRSLQWKHHCSFFHQKNDVVYFFYES